VDRSLQVDGTGPGEAMVSRSRLLANHFTTASDARTSLPPDLTRQPTVGHRRRIPVHPCPHHRFGCGVTGLPCAVGSVASVVTAPSRATFLTRGTHSSRRCEFGCSYSNT
jgi:hypothetical protein